MLSHTAGDTGVHQTESLEGWVSSESVGSVMEAFLLKTSGLATEVMALASLKGRVLRNWDMTDSTGNVGFSLQWKIKCSPYFSIPCKLIGHKFS